MAQANHGTSGVATARFAFENRTRTGSQGRTVQPIAASVPRISVLMKVILTASVDSDRAALRAIRGNITRARGTVNCVSANPIWAAGE